MSFEVWIRTEALSRTGLGHAMRCMAVAEQLVVIGTEVHWLLDAESIKNLSSFVLPGVVHPLPRSIAKDDLSDWPCLQHTARVARIAIFDSYDLRPQMFSAAREVFAATVLFDDALRDDSSDVDLIINGSPAASAGHYQNFRARCLLGPDYLAMRSIYGEGCRVREPRQEGRELLVCFGGADPLDYTGQFLEHWREYGDIAGIPVHLVTGPGYPRLSELSQVLCGMSGIRHSHALSDLLPAYWEARLCLCAAGSMMFELALIGVPIAALVSASNQVASARAMAELGAIWMNDVRESANWSQVLAQLSHLWQSEEVRREMVISARRLLDGRGAQRIAHEIRVLAENL